MSTEVTADERHFNKIFWFVVCYSLILTGLMSAIVFCRVPKENTQMANMTLSYIFGLISGVTGVIIITNSDKKKDPTIPVNGTQVIVTDTTDKGTNITTSASPEIK